MKNLCPYGKEVKHRLIDLDKSQEWLIEQVRKDTGLFFDSSYLHKILLGTHKSPTIIASINRILAKDE